MNFVSLKPMKRLILNRTKRFFTLLILGAFIFSFLHSELGLFDYDNGNHESHDYCLIVKNSHVHSVKTVTVQPIKEIVEKTVCLHCFEEIQGQEDLSLIVNNEFSSPRHSSEIYLHNNTFLI